jgi:hypothetical protein
MPMRKLMVSQVRRMLKRRFQWAQAGEELCHGRDGAAGIGIRSCLGGVCVSKHCPGISHEARWKPR